MVDSRHAGACDSMHLNFIMFPNHGHHISFAYWVSALHFKKLSLITATEELTHDCASEYYSHTCSGYHTYRTCISALPLPACECLTKGVRIWKSVCTPYYSRPKQVLNAIRSTYLHCALSDGNIGPHVSTWRRDRTNTCALLRPNFVPITLRRPSNQSL